MTTTELLLGLPLLAGIVLFAAFIVYPYIKSRHSR